MDWIFFISFFLLIYLFAIHFYFYVVLFWWGFYSHVLYFYPTKLVGCRTISYPYISLLHVFLDVFSAVSVLRITPCLIRVCYILAIDIERVRGAC